MLVGELWRRVCFWWRRDECDTELREEIRAHLEQCVADEVARGVAPQEARRRAVLRCGNPAWLHEESRGAWGVNAVEALAADVRYALRIMRKAPMFTAVALLTLALGIGANTAIFSGLHAVMLRLLPVPEPERLLLLTWTAKAWPGKVVSDLEGSSRRLNGYSWSYSFSLATYEYMRQHNQTFAGTFAFAANTDQVNAGLEGRAEAVQSQAVSGDFFSTVQVRAALGRTLQPADDVAGAPRVAVVSYNFWRRKLGGDPRVIGKSLAVNGAPVEVVGVLPREFFGLQPGEAPDLWIPLTTYCEQMLQADHFEVRTPQVWWLAVGGRLKPDATPEQAHAEMSVLFRQSLGDTSRLGPDDIPQVEVAPVAQVLNQLRRQFSRSLLVLMAMVGVVLLMTCANVAGLLLARATARQREIAVRLSLGAPRQRLVRQLLTESVLLALLGGASGLLLARWTASLLVRLLSSGRRAVSLELVLDWPVLAFTAAVAIACGVLFGLLPALRATRVDILPHLKQVGTATAGPARFFAGKFLVAGQVALALLLVVAAGLLLNTLRRLKSVDLGFARENLISFRVQPGSNGDVRERLLAYYAELQRRIGAVPAVESATLSQLGPIASGSSSTSIDIPGYTAPGKRADVWRHWVAPNYFATLRLPIVAGRGLEERDAEGAPLVAVVNRQFVIKYLHGDNPIGRTLALGRDPSTRKPNGIVATIVGVAGDAKYNNIRDDAPPTMYLSYLQRVVRGELQPFAMMTYLIRTHGDPARAIAAIQRQALELDPNVPIIGLHSETELVDQVLFLERTFAVLSASFGALALLLACVGLYGTIGYTVAQRTNEIGIRMALGAQPANILSMFLRDTARVVLGGIAIGAPLTFVASRLIGAQLYGLSPHDPMTLLVAMTALVGVTLVAGFLPARRAARVDPMVALRNE
jgi:predicted permease